jgi:hypothetical protein
MKRLDWRNITLAVWLLAGAAAAQAESAGTVEFLSGQPQVQRSSGAVRVAVGGALQEGDVISTDARSELQANMADGAYMVIRPNSLAVVREYKTADPSLASAIVDLSKGAMRMVTGWIGKTNPQNVQVRTATATIGIRGTDHEVIVDDSAGSAGTHSVVYEGQTELRGAKGVVQVGPGAAGFADRSGAAPRLGRPPMALMARFGRSNDNRLVAHRQQITRHMQDSLQRRGLLKRNESFDQFMQRHRAANPARANPAAQHLADRAQARAQGQRPERSGPLPQQSRAGGAAQGQHGRVGAGARTDLPGQRRQGTENKGDTKNAAGQSKQEPGKRGADSAPGKAKAPATKQAPAKPTPNAPPAPPIVKKHDPKKP